MFLLVALLSGCATPYQAAGFQGGFTETHIAGTDDEFVIEFNGNVGLDQGALEQSLLRRAAEVAVQHGFRHFLVVSRNRQAGLGFVLRPGVVGPARQTTRSIHIRCLPGEYGLPGSIDARQLLEPAKDETKPSTI